MLIIRIITVRTTAEAKARSLTSAIGELNWKNIDKGSVAVG